MNLFMSSSPPSSSLYSARRTSLLRPAHTFPSSPSPLPLLSQKPFWFQHRRGHCSCCTPIVTARASSSPSQEDQRQQESDKDDEEEEELQVGGDMARTKRQQLQLQQQQQQHHPLLNRINDSTKWWVSAAVFSLLVSKHDAYVAWAVVGSIVAAFNNKLLKRLIQQSRPDSARGKEKQDPGMPSSHAQSLAFLSTYSIIGIQYLSPSSLPSLSSSSSFLSESALMLVLSILVAFVGVFLAWLRVELGFHTREQVVVGVAVGIISACGWQWLGTAFAFPLIQTHPELTVYLSCLTALAVCIFGSKTVSTWAKERKKEG